MQSKLKPGEKGFSIVLLFLGVGLLVESIKMFMEDPTAASFGALPLFLSISVIILMIKIIFFEDKKKESESSDLSIGDIIKVSLSYIFKKDIVIIFLLLISYCIALFLGLGFVISSSIFLFLAMSYLIGDKKQIFKNLIYTAVSMTFILVVFKNVFQVILP